MSADLQTTLDSLERRLADLQCKVMGDSTAPDRSDGETVTDLLTDATASIRAALSGRDKVASVAARTSDLDRYLDPTFEEEGDSIDASALVECALSSGPELRSSLGLLERLVELSPALDSEAMAGVGTQEDRLARVTAAALDAHAAGGGRRSRAYALVEEYNAIIVNMTRTLVQWDDAVTRLEIEARPRKPADE